MGRQLHRRRGSRRVRALVWLALASFAGGAEAGPVMEVKQLTNDAIHDLPPRIEGHRVVWQHDIGNAAEIYLYDGTNVVQISNNGVPDEEPAIDGSIVVWQQWDGNDWELERYDIDAQQLSYLTTNDVDDEHPVVASIFTAWQAFAQDSEEIFLASPVTQITGDLDYDDPPVISGPFGSLAWVKHSAAGTDVYAWLPQNPDGGGMYQLSDPSGYRTNVQPSVWNNRVAWVEGDGSGSNEEIWRYDPVAPYPLLRITDDKLRDRNPQIFGDTIVWEHFDGDDYEIYYWIEGDASPHPLTNNAWDDYDVHISGKNLVWVADEPGNTQIWVSWNLGAPERLTNSAFGNYDPVIDNQRIAWRQCDLVHCDIMTAPEPQQALLAAAALATLGVLTLRVRPRPVAVARSRRKPR